MTRWFRAVALAATALAVTAVPLAAADLDDVEPPRRFGSPYDDPRYADLYGDAPLVAPRPERRYALPYPPHRPHPDYDPRPAYGYAQPPIPRVPVYRDEPAPRRYVDLEPRSPRDDYGYGYGRAPGCLGKDAVRWQLERQGWQGFHDPRVVDRDVAWVKARRPSGRLFQLQLDRCSGEILAARPLEPRYGSPYADYDGRPRYRY
jgi:hypothetical protein